MPLVGVARDSKSFLVRIDYLQTYQKPQPPLMSLTRHLSHMSASLIRWKDLWLHARNRKIYKEQTRTEKTVWRNQMVTKMQEPTEKRLNGWSLWCGGFPLQFSCKARGWWSQHKRTMPMNCQNILKCKTQSAPRQTQKKKDFAFWHSPTNLSSTLLPEKTCNLVYVKLWFDNLGLPTTEDGMNHKKDQPNLFIWTKLV